MPLIELEISDRVATLTLCRPEALNAINQALLREFEETLRQCAGGFRCGSACHTGQRASVFCGQ